MMPYMCSNCGYEGREEGEENIPYDVYEWYAYMTTVDGCEHCPEEKSSRKDTSENLEDNTGYNEKREIRH